MILRHRARAKLEETENGVERKSWGGGERFDTFNIIDFNTTWGKNHYLVLTKIKCKDHHMTFSRLLESEVLET